MIPLPSSASSFLDSRRTPLVINDTDRNGSDSDRNDDIVDDGNAVSSAKRRSIRKEERNPSRSDGYAKGCDMSKSRDSRSSGKNRRRTISMSRSVQTTDVCHTPSLEKSKMCNSDMSFHLIVRETHGEDYEVPLKSNSSISRWNKTEGRKQVLAREVSYRRQQQRKSMAEVRQEQKIMEESSCNYFDLVIPKQDDLTPVSSISLDDPDWLEEFYHETVGTVDSKKTERQVDVELPTFVEASPSTNQDTNFSNRPPVRHRSLPHPRHDAVELNCPPFYDDGLRRKHVHDSDGENATNTLTATTHFSSGRVAVNLKKPIPEKVTAYLQSTAWEEHQRILTDWRHFVNETRPMLSRWETQLSSDSCSPTRIANELGARALSRSISFSPVQKLGEAFAEHDDLMSLLDPREVEQRKKILQLTLGRAKKIN